MLRRLLAAFCSSVALLVDLSALAQMAQDSTDFSGVIPATCSITGLAETKQLILRSNNSLVATDAFRLLTNSSMIRVSITGIAVEQQPVATASAIIASASLHQLVGNRYLMVAHRTSPTSDPLAVSTLEENTFSLMMTVLTEQYVNDAYELPLGDYSYVVTISCLL